MKDDDSSDRNEIGHLLLSTHRHSTKKRQVTLKLRKSNTLKHTPVEPLSPQLFQSPSKTISKNLQMMLSLVQSKSSKTKSLSNLSKVPNSVKSHPAYQIPSPKTSGKLGSDGSGKRFKLIHKSKLPRAKTLKNELTLEEEMDKKVMWRGKFGKMKSSVKSKKVKSSKLFI